jgi:hypothetical protein
MLEFVSGSAILRINQNVPTIDCFPTGTSHHEGNLDVRRVPPGDDRDFSRFKLGGSREDIKFKCFRLTYLYRNHHKKNHHINFGW